MTNTTAAMHIARTRRLVAVATAFMAFGCGALTVNRAGSANPAPSRPAITATPTATTAAPAN
jgi:hypothetical protein